MEQFNYEWIAREAEYQAKEVGKLTEGELDWLVGKLIEGEEGLADEVHDPAHVTYYNIECGGHDIQFIMWSGKGRNDYAVEKAWCVMQRVCYTVIVMFKAFRGRYSEADLELAKDFYNSRPELTPNDLNWFPDWEKLDYKVVPICAWSSKHWAEYYACNRA